ncbi:ankyrin [Piromyces finnis]|uniref:Ankyrin n=1 Tax=Piromyces finnis TaxID=1754191 RepID=A0A1Y1V2B0_9FUNG|nr:ankyrin [Piromyces finnis]|eukprot:ORX44871.1 ankyrin [Piromyces finnis]
MDYEEFEVQLFHCIIYNQNCNVIIDQNEQLIRNSFGEKEGRYINSFIKKLNCIIINNVNNYLKVKYILHLPLFENVLSKFRNSDILVKACVSGNVKMVKWLLDINVNLYIQDENGMTALMHAVKNSDLLFVVDYYLKNETGSINITDNNGETALFHSLKNKEALRKLAQNINTDQNHINNQGDNILLHCVKYNNNIIEPLRILVNLSINLNAVDCNDYTAVMHLVNKGNFEELNLFIGKHVDLDYRNKNDETVLSILIKNIYSLHCMNDPDSIYKYIKILTTLVKMDCDFNGSIDEEGNTPLMFFIMMKDYCSINYILKFSIKLNVSIPNKNGITAFMYSLKDGNNYLIKRIINHKTFNFEYFDVYRNNLLMNYTCNNNYYMVNHIIKLYPHLINEVNYNNDNALLLASKFGYSTIVHMFLENKVNVNQCDKKGNNSLYYAVEKKNLEMINNLAFSQCNINHKNKEGISPYHLAIKTEDEKIINALLHPVKQTINIEEIIKKRKKDFLENNDSDHLEYKLMETYKLTYSLNENIIKFEMAKFHNKYEQIEYRKEIAKAIFYSYYKDTTSQSFFINPTLNRLLNQSLSDILEFSGTLVDIIGDLGGS